MFNRAGLGVMRETARNQVPWVSNTPIEPVYLAGGLVEDRNRKTADDGTHGTIKINTTPTGANVFVDGKAAGKTPVELGNMAPGNKTIRVEKDGYVPEEKETTIHKGRRSVVRFDLVQEVRKGWLTVSLSPSDAQVKILNISPRYRKGMALDPGRYHVEVSADGYTTREEWVGLAAGDALDLVITLQKVPASPSRGFTESTTNMEFVRIPDGCFQMGQSEAEKEQLIAERGKDTYEKYYNDELPRHEVCVDAFYMGKYEVTVGQWRKFIRDSNYKTDAEKDTGGVKGCYAYKDGKWDWREGRDWENPGFSQSSEQPVACVSHNDVTAFIRWLNRQGNKVFRLPTEAEWEYAARGGTSTIRYWGDAADSKACGYANVADRGHGWNNNFPCDDGYEWSSPVGSFKANNYGLYDMLGNVWEWCSDRYASDYYKSSPRNNPQGPSSGSDRVFRGGSWDYRPSIVRAANRFGIGAAYRYVIMGFRLVSSGQ
jgi:formylglycine-generating enzyme required for sulfatase activity